MKHEKYYTFDGSANIIFSDTRDELAWECLIKNSVGHFRFITENGKKITLMALRSNKDQMGDVFEILDLPKFMEIKKGTPEEKHGKHSWDLSDAIIEIARVETEVQQLNENKKIADDAILELTTQKNLEIDKKKLTSDPVMISEHDFRITIITEDMGLQQVEINKIQSLLKLNKREMDNANNKKIAAEIGLANLGA